jgi:hypothetical protein
MLNRILMAAAAVAVLAVPAAASAAHSGSHAPSKVVTHKPCKAKHTKVCKFVKRAKQIKASRVLPLNGKNGLNGHDGANGANGKDGAQGLVGPQGIKGDKGDSYLAGAYYSIAYYNAGDTNAGAIATVACKNTTDTAISGGVSVDDYLKNTPVSQSFPGRMDWSTNTPKPNRLDGWVIQFGGNAGATSDKSPEKVKVWALCVPGLSIPVEQTYTQS